MAQLKIKQISDFISGVNAIHNGAAGTDTVSAISTAKSEAISQAVVNGDIAYDVNGAGAAAIAAAESKDVVRASTTATNLGTAVSNLESYADQAEVDAKSYADGLASDYDANGSAAAAQSAAISAAESKDVLRATTAVTNIATAKSEAISQAVVNGDLAYDAKGDAAAQKLRIDAIVEDAGEQFDTFLEIKTFVDELATADIVGLSSAISTAQSTAISAAESKDVLRATTAVTNIATAKSEAISQAVVNGDLAYDAKGDAAAAQSAAIASAESKDVVRATASQAYADQAEVDAKSYADGLASDAEIAAIASAESKDVVRATASQSYADQAEVDAIAAAESKDVVRATASQSYTDQAAADAAAAATAAAESKDAVRATASQSYTDQAEADAIAAAGSYTDTREVSILSVLRGELSAVAGTDILEQVGVFASITSFRAATQLSLVNNDILVFVNGLQDSQSF